MPSDVVAASAAKDPVQKSASNTATWSLVSLSLSMLLASLNTSIANAGLPALSQALSASFAEAQWVVLAYLLSITTMVVTAGRLGDIIGRKKLLILGLAGFTIASIVCSSAPSLPLLLAGRVVQGLGAAIMMSLSVAFVTETAPKNKVGSALGLLGTMSAAGTALGPSLGGILIAGLGWRAIFFVSVPLGALAYVLAHQSLPKDRARGKNDLPRLDGLGTSLLALSLAAYMLSMTLGKGSFGVTNALLGAASLVGAALFVLAQRKVQSPLVQPNLLKDSRLGASLISSALVSCVMMSTLVVGPFYLARALGLGELHRGLALSIGPVAAALAGVPSGRMVDRFGPVLTAVVGLGALIVGSLLLAMSGPQLGLWGYALPIIVMTGGYALFQTANNTAVMSSIPQEQKGVVSGALNLSRNLGLVTGAASMGAVFALASGMKEVASADPLAVAHGMRVTLTVSVVCLVLALAFVLWGTAVGRRQTSPT